MSNRSNTVQRCNSAKITIAALLTTLCAIPSPSVMADGVALRPEVRQFVDDMVTRHHFNRDELTVLLGQAQTRQDIIAAITRPAEAKPWFQYRPIFITEARIKGGVEFWNKHQDLLERTQAAYGVPPEIITAIVGVETRYGANTGGFRVLDALYTLGFDYPPRGKFFLGELENFLLLSRDEKFDPLILKGSYAGAMGQPQFIPSSYRNFSVDFDADGTRNLWNNAADIIGSVGYYFYAHGWQPDQPVTSRAQVEGERYKDVLSNDLKPTRNLASLKENGVTIADDIAADRPGALLEFKIESGSEYWIGWQNFYVITRYNRSPLYAMAVHQLSQEIRAARRKSGTAAATVSNKED